MLARPRAYDRVHVWQTNCAVKPLVDHVAEALTPDD